MNDIGRLLRTAARVSRTRYPGFIFGLPLARGEIPVFTYHDVETQVFARDLEFLHSNGYRTLSLEEYLAARNGRRDVSGLRRFRKQPVPHGTTNKSLYPPNHEGTHERGKLIGII